MCCTLQTIFRFQGVENREHSLVRTGRGLCDTLRMCNNLQGCAHGSTHPETGNTWSATVLSEPLWSRPLRQICCSTYISNLNHVANIKERSSTYSKFRKSSTDGHSTNSKQLNSTYSKFQKDGTDGHYNPPSWLLRGANGSPETKLVPCRKLYIVYRRPTAPSPDGCFQCKYSMYLPQLIY